jgi:hypothetical protein
LVPSDWNPWANTIEAIGAGADGGGGGGNNDYNTENAADQTSIGGQGLIRITYIGTDCK